MTKKVRFRILNGYRVIYMPDHPKAMISNNWNGFVYEHIAVAEKAIGRQLTPDEVVHHKDENRQNNSISNLEVMTRSEHASLHNEAKKLKKPLCKVCGKAVTTIRNKFCSNGCRAISSRKVERPSKEKLTKLIKEKSLSAIGRQFNVSDNAVRKWAKLYGILDK